MRPPVDLEKAKAIIQGWYDEYCRVYDKPNIELEISENEASGAYHIAIPSRGASSTIFWSTVSDYEKYGGQGIPGDLMESITYAFEDLE